MITKALPKLKGSPKQIKWATKIRQEFLDRGIEQARTETEAKNFINWDIENFPNTQFDFYCDHEGFCYVEFTREFEGDYFLAKILNTYNQYPVFTVKNIPVFTGFIPLPEDENWDYLGSFWGHSVSDAIRSARAQDPLPRLIGNKRYREKAW
jgi:hypothetical protein